MKANRITHWPILFLILGFTVVTGCAPKVTRVEPERTIDLSGYWNDSDSQRVAVSMIAEVFKGTWLSDFESSHGGKRPTVIVGTVRNRSSEHINTSTFTKDLEKAFIDSGKVDVVASADEREELRAERAEQTGMGSMAEEQKADFMIQGTLNAITDTTKGIIEHEKVLYYQVNLELVNIHTNKKVWIGQTELKKYVERVGKKI